MDRWLLRKTVVESLLSSTQPPTRRAELGWLADTLQRAGRLAGRPGLLWLAGYAYHFLSFGWTFGLVLAVPYVDQVAPGGNWEALREVGRSDLLQVVSYGNLALCLMLLPLALAMSRVAGGLARLADSDRWRAAALIAGRPRPPLRRAWSEGRGTSRAAGLLWLQVLLMMGLVAATLALPSFAVLRALNVEGWSPLTAVISGLAVVLTLVYGFLLGILFQLALHSLVRNRRGVGSALLHAWRLVRNDPGAALRATAMDAVLQLMATACQWSVLILTSLIPAALPLAILAYPVIPACVGCVRCLYWADVYEELGGLSTAQA